MRPVLANIDVSQCHRGQFVVACLGQPEFHAAPRGNPGLTEGPVVPCRAFFVLVVRVG